MSQTSLAQHGILSCNKDEVYFRGLWDLAGGPALAIHNATQIMDAIDSSDSMEIKWATKQSGALVDFGCATGEGTNAWKVKYPWKTVYGIDQCPSAVYLATRRNTCCIFGHAMPPADIDVIVAANSLQETNVPPQHEFRRQLLTAKRAWLACVPYKDEKWGKDAWFDDTFFPEEIELGSGEFAIRRIFQQMHKQHPQAAWNQWIVGYTREVGK